MDAVPHRGRAACLLALWAVTAVTGQGRSQGPPATIALWPEGVPGALANAGPEVQVDGRVSNVHVPTLTAFPASPARNTGTAIVVCPGGAYRRLAIEKEGRAVAEWLNTLGVSAFVLKYRLQEYRYPAALRDVLRAIRLLRAEAPRWQIARERIGVLGFSAGGHLAASAGTLFDDPDGRTGASLDDTSARPDFMVLVYPVIDLEGPYASSRSRESLLGNDPDPIAARRLSLTTRVTRDTPATFLAHGGTDAEVPAESSLNFYAALRRAGVPAELHVYAEGPHGFALETTEGPLSTWPDRCADWMRARGLLEGVRAGELE